MSSVLIIKKSEREAFIQELTDVWAVKTFGIGPCINLDECNGRLKTCLPLVNPKIAHDYDKILFCRKCCSMFLFYLLYFLLFIHSQHTLESCALVSSAVNQLIAKRRMVSLSIRDANVKWMLCSLTALLCVVCCKSIKCG